MLHVLHRHLSVCLSLCLFVCLHINVLRQVTVRFSGNNASVGPALLISHLQHCSWYQSDRVQTDSINEVLTIFSVKHFVNWTVFD